LLTSRRTPRSTLFPYTTLFRSEASAAVSAGNTGALMAISKLALRTIPGIDRPALAALLPTMKDSDVVMLDLGANAECDSRNLVQDRKSTRLNSSHVKISYAVFC